MNPLRSGRAFPHAPTSTTANTPTPSGTTGCAAPPSSPPPHDATECPYTPRERDALHYHVPFGESALPHMRAGSLRDSLIHLFNFEKIHAAAHRALARKYNLDIQRQDVRLATGVTEKGELVAVAGVTETRFVPASRGISETPPPEPGMDSSPLQDAPDTPPILPVSPGKTPDATPTPTEPLLLRELAFLQPGSQLLRVGGAAIYGESRRVLPLLKTSGSMGAYRRALGNASAIRQQTDRPDILSLLRTLRPQALDEMIRAIEPLESELRQLAARLDTIESSPTALTGVTLTGGIPQVKGEILSVNTPIRAYAVQVRQRAAAHEIRTDFQGWLLQPFGSMKAPDGTPVLEGERATFTLNGTAFTVEASDTPFTLVHAINRAWSSGRDANGNDTANNNSNNNNANGSTHDTPAHGIRASVEAGQIHLRATPESNRRIQVSDPDHILRNLRLVEDGEDGRMRFVAEASTPRGGIVLVDGVATHTETNITDRAISGVRLTLLEEGTKPVTLTVGGDFQTLRRELDDLATSYNRILEAFGKALGSAHGGLLAHQIPISLAYLDLAGSTQDPFREPFGSWRHPSDLGLASNPSNRATFHAAQLESAVQRLRQGSAHPLQKAQSPDSVYNRLGTVGVTRSLPDTLTIQHTRLHESVKQDLESVRAALRDTDMGWVVRMAKAAQTGSRDDTGRLALGALRLQTLRGAGIPGWLPGAASSSMHNLELLRQLTPLDLLG